MQIKKCQKQGGLCTGITQNYTATTMFANSEFVALLKQANTDLISCIIPTYTKKLSYSIFWHLVNGIVSINRLYLLTYHANNRENSFSLIAGWN